MTELVITRGLPAAGKTTFARAWVADRDDRARVNRDETRFMLFGQWWGLTDEQEDLVTVAQHGAVRALLTRDVSVVVDDTNLQLERARNLADVAALVGAGFTVVDILTSQRECLRRDADRGRAGERSVGGDVIRKMWQKYLADGPLDVVLPTVPRTDGRP